MLAKRRRVDVECRGFSKVWTDKHFFIKHIGKPTGLIHNEYVAANKEFNAKHRHETKHSKFLSLVFKQEKTKLIDIIYLWKAKFYQKKCSCQLRGGEFISNNMKSLTDEDFVKECTAR